MATVGFDKQISGALQIGSDVSYSDDAEIQSSGDVSATPARQDWYYTLRFRSDDIFGSQTFSALYLRYVDGPDSTATCRYSRWRSSATTLASDSERCFSGVD